MSPVLLLSFVGAYFLLLLLVARYTSRNANNDSFFIGNRNSNWLLVAFGMIGTSLSGVTFVSVPGAVGREGFAYFQITLGYVIGYILIAFVLLPLYYRLNLTSIYNYLSTRLGYASYKTGASFFILSRTLGATARLYLVVKILQDAILTQFEIPFWVTTLVILIMILVYTYEGGVKTIVFTDTLQTTFMLAGLVICVIYIMNALGLDFSGATSAMQEKGYSRIFFSDPNSKLFFVKQILAGMFITITMTGMDQEMMQKTISVKRLKDSQKNIITLSLILVGVILLFLFLGGLLHLYAEQFGTGVTGDKLFPDVALNHMRAFVSVIFIIALISALFPSADGAITALTCSFCIDILGINRKGSPLSKDSKDLLQSPHEMALDEAQKKKIRQRVHLSVAFVFLVFVLVFYKLNNPSMIGVILKVAAYTYGPLLGLFTFGILTKRQVHDKLVPVICVLSPIICFVFDLYQKDIFGTFEIGSELLIVNGALTFIGLMIISKKRSAENIIHVPHHPEG